MEGCGNTCAALFRAVDAALEGEIALKGEAARAGEAALEGEAARAMEAARIEENTRIGEEGGGSASDGGGPYTELVTKLRATHGEEAGQLYLVWGAVDNPDVAYDELERAEGDSDDFAFVAHVRRETQNGVPLVCMRYEDLGLKDHARYRYRVRHVFKNGAKGAWQPACEGLTREGPAGGN